MKFRPLHDRHLAQRVTLGNTTSHGLFMPDTSQAHSVKASDRVLIREQEVSEIKLDDEDLIILHEDDILDISEPLRSRR